MRKFRIVIILLTSVFLLQGCSDPQSSQDADVLSHLLDDFSKSIADGIPADMTLTVYSTTIYMSPDMPLDEAGLISIGSDSKDPTSGGKAVIDSTQLSFKIDQLKYISSLSLRKPLISRYKDLRIYYVIETETAGKVLEVGLNGFGGPVFVNGVEVKYDSVFFDLVETYAYSYTMSRRTD